MDEPGIDDIANELRSLRRVGLPALRLRAGNFPGLCSVADLVYGSGGPAEIELLLRDAWHLLGGGPHGQTVGVLFGLEQGHRGGSPSALRSKAAERAGYYSVDTFRKKPEQAAVNSLATAVIGVRAQKKLLGATSSEDKVGRIVAQIEALTTVESAELARRLRQLFSPS